MIVLDSTKKIVAFLGATVTANQPEFVASYSDATTTSFTEGNQMGALSNSTAIDIVTAPSTGQRLVKTIWIHNKDTAVATVTVEIDQAATRRRICKTTLQTNETLEIGEAGIRIISTTAALVYAEGTFTPTLIGTTGTIGSYAVAAAIGRYTRLGNRVLFNLYIELTNKGSWTGDVRLSGMPFPNAAGTYFVPGFTFSGITFSASKVGLGAYLPASTSSFIITEIQSATVSNLLPYANINATSWIMMAGAYEV